MHLKGRDSWWPACTPAEGVKALPRRWGIQKTAGLCPAQSYRPLSCLPSSVSIIFQNSPAEIPHAQEVGSWGSITHRADSAQIQVFPPAPVTEKGNLSLPIYFFSLEKSPVEQICLGLALKLTRQYKALSPELPMSGNSRCWGAVSYEG